MSINNDPRWANLDPRLKITEIRDYPPHHNKETYLDTPLYVQQREKSINVHQTEPINVQQTKKSYQDIPSTCVNVINSSLRDKPQETSSVKETGIDKAFKTCLKKLGRIDHEFISHTKDIHDEKMAVLTSELLSIERGEHPGLNEKLEQTEQKHKETIKLLHDQISFEEERIEKKYEEDEQEVNDDINRQIDLADNIVRSELRSKGLLKKSNRKRRDQEVETPVKQVYRDKLFLKKKVARLHSGHDRRKKTKENMTIADEKKGPDPIAAQEIAALLHERRGVKKNSRLNKTR